MKEIVLVTSKEKISFLVDEVTSNFLPIEEEISVGNYSLYIEDGYVILSEEKIQPFALEQKKIKIVIKCDTTRSSFILNFQIRKIVESYLYCDYFVEDLLFHKLILNFIEKNLFNITSREISTIVYRPHFIISTQNSSILIDESEEFMKMMHLKILSLREGEREYSRKLNKIDEIITLIEKRIFEVLRIKERGFAIENTLQSGKYLIFIVQKILKF